MLSFNQFILESLDFGEITRLMDLGMVSQTDARRQLLSSIKTAIKPGTNWWEPVNKPIMRQLPASAAIWEPEFKPFADAGFTPASSQLQLINGTLVLTKPDSRAIMFFRSSSSVRVSYPNEQAILLKGIDTSGSGIEFYTRAMKSMVEVYDITSREVASKKTVSKRLETADVEGTALEAIITAISTGFPNISKPREFATAILSDVRRTLSPKTLLVKLPRIVAKIEAGIIPIGKLLDHNQLLGEYAKAVSILRLIREGQISNATKFCILSSTTMYYYRESELEQIVRELDNLDPTCTSPINLVNVNHDQVPQEISAKLERFPFVKIK